MQTEKIRISRRLKTWFLLCPVRHVLALAGALTICAYFLLRGNRTLMLWCCEHITIPWHRFFGQLCNALPFSVCAVLLASAVIGCLVYIIFQAVRIIRNSAKLRTLYATLLTLLSAVLVIYGGFCVLWGVYYYASDFEEQSGIVPVSSTPAQLETVTTYFAVLANQYGVQVSRDAEGLYAPDMEAIFALSPELYASVETHFACLSGTPLRAKPFLFSRAMSYIKFTGFFFPFTGEANINVDAPACLVPSTIAHELAHQRGVAPEDEANFVAVLACLENGNPDYCYSACLLSYIHLSNALYAADYDAWQRVSELLSPEVRGDMRFNNAYWAQFDTPVSAASDAVYTGFLQNYGQSLGLQSYGACVDLLVAYYYDAAKEAS